MEFPGFGIIFRSSMTLSFCASLESFQLEMAGFGRNM
jgi:hypothetical protein